MKFTHLVVALATVIPTLALADPRYQVTDLGVLAGTTDSQAVAVSSNGLYVTGRSYSTTSNPGLAFVWSPLPVMWTNGTATQLAMPAGQTAGRAYDINDSGMAVGSVGSGATEFATIYNTNLGTSSLITATTASGAYMQTAWAVSGNGMVAGVGVTSSGLNVALVYNNSTGTMTQLAMPDYSGTNNSLAYDISENGQYVVGTSGNSSQPFIWSTATGTPVEPLATDGSGGILRGVNDQGQAVGTFGGQYANPSLSSGGQSYRLGDIVVNGAGWNFGATTSASAQDIAADGSIVGWAVLDSHAHAFVLSAVPEPASYALMAAGLIAEEALTRRRPSVRC